MAYSTTGGLPVLIAGGFGGSPMRLWAYESTHTIGAVAATSFISNGYGLGMRIGDRVFVNEVTTAGAYTAHATGVVSSQTTGAGVTLVFTATST